MVFNGLKWSKIVSDGIFMGGVPLLPPKYDSQKTNDFDEIITGNNSTPTKKLIKAQIKRISAEFFN